MKKPGMLALFVFSFQLLSAQHDSSKDSIPAFIISANVQHGVMLPEYGFMSLLSDNYTNGFEINACKLTSGESIWDRMYRYPCFGVSFYFTTMGSATYFGNQFALYPYYSLNIFRHRWFELNYQMGVGAAWSTKKYDRDNNYQNVAIGSHMNIHYHADLIAQFRLNDRLYFQSGISFTHISNANLSEPNVGINATALYAGIGYAIGKQRQYSGDKPPFDPFFTYEVMIAGGMKHTRTFESFRYPAFAVSFDAKRRFGYKFALGLGADFFYDTSTEPQMKRRGMEFKSSDAYTSGIHLAEEFVYNRFSLIVQEGIYLGLTDHLNNYLMYNRAIVRYKFCGHWFVNLSMKSHLYILDFPEVGAGYYW